MTDNKSLNAGLISGCVALRPPPARRYRIHTSVSVGSVLPASACPRLSRPGGALHRICHGMSCFVMRGVRMAGPDRACCGRPGPAVRVFRPVSPACGFRHRSLLSIRLRFVFPPPGCPARGPHYAARNRGRAGGRVGAGAVRAPDCARARARAQGAPLLPAPSVVFRAGAGAGGSGLRKPLPIFCSVFILAHLAGLQALRRYFFITSCQEIEHSGKNAAFRDRRRPPPRIGSGGGTGVGRERKGRPARPGGTPDKRRCEMCACGSRSAGGAGGGSLSGYRPDR